MRRTDAYTPDEQRRRERQCSDAFYGNVIGIGELLDSLQGHMMRDRANTNVADRRDQARRTPRFASHTEWPIACRTGKEKQHAEAHACRRYNPRVKRKTRGVS